MLRLWQAAAETFLLCSARLGVCPQIEVRGDRDASFTCARSQRKRLEAVELFTPQAVNRYVPKHIFFVASELLKNAAAATVDFHASRGRGGGLPPVRIVVACGENEMAIKVADEGGGIARSRLAEVWSYRGARLAGGFGLAARSDADELVRSPEASAGLGLPLARLHCKFFGGSLHLTPMEDGTDSNTNINTDFHTHLVLKHGVAVYPQQRPGWGCPPPRWRGSRRGQVRPEGVDGRLAGWA